MKKFLILTVAALACGTSMFAEEKVLWETGMEGLDDTNGTVPGEYQTGLIVSPDTFEGLAAGTQLNIDINSSAWAQIYLKNYEGSQIFPTIDINAGQNVTVVLTNFQLDQIADGGLRIDASTGLEITKVTADKDLYSGDFANALWIGNQAFTADWGGLPVQICALEAAGVKEGDTLTVYYSKSADDYSLMVNYVNSDGSQTDCTHEWIYNDGKASFVIEKSFADALAQNNKGFVVKGASIVVSQVDLAEYKGAESGVVTVYEELNPKADVYSITGALLHKGVDSCDILSRLSSGIYIIGNKKVVIR